MSFSLDVVNSMAVVTDQIGPGSTLVLLVAVTGATLVLVFVAGMVVRILGARW